MSNNGESRRLPSLKDVLDRVNRAVTDFLFQPAVKATDVGSTGDSPLHKVVIWGDVDAAGVLLMHGADINAPGEDDDTPLHRAVASEKVEIVTFLLLKGGDPDLKNSFGWSARDSGLVSKIPEIVEAMQKCKPLR